MSDFKADDAASTPNPAEKQALTAREQELLGKLINCVKAPIEVDYEKLAAAMGMGNVRSASNAWGILKKKLGNPDLLGTPTKEPKTPGTKTPRKRTAKTPANDDDENGEAAETPTKKRRGVASKAKGKVAKKEADVDDEDVDVKAPIEEDAGLV